MGRIFGGIISSASCDVIRAASYARCDPAPQAPSADILIRRRLAAAASRRFRQMQ
jgi:hypothetical protein